MTMKPLIPILTVGLLAAGCTSNSSATQAAGSPYAQPQPSAYTQPQPSATVRDAQQRLSTLGFYAGPVDGIWGPDTQAAVERFQRNRGLQVTGDLNQVTTSALQAAPQPSANVRDTQQRLSALGFYNGAVDGVWGADTRRAVERFQRSRGLAVTGDLNQATASALRSAPPPAPVASGPATPPAATPPEAAQATDPTAVRTVQNRLHQLGFFNDPADGVWGPSTQVALENFQRARGLEVSGQLTPPTVAAMGFEPGSFPPRSTASAAEPLDPAVVKSAQRELRRLGFYRGTADGVWGARSQDALARFQQSRGLQASGEFNPATLSALGFDPNNLAASAARPRYSASVPR
jgi:peptidoglycan hydrolase-like protein with peptidoglycan-binding domain